MVTDNTDTMIMTFNYDDTIEMNKDNARHTPVMIMTYGH